MPDRLEIEGNHCWQYRLNKDRKDEFLVKEWEIGNHDETVKYGEKYDNGEGGLPAVSGQE